MDDIDDDDDYNDEGDNDNDDGGGGYIDNVPKGPSGLLRVQLCLHGAAKGLQDGHQQICSNQGVKFFLLLHSVLRNDPLKKVLFAEYSLVV